MTPTSPDPAAASDRFGAGRLATRLAARPAFVRFAVAAVAGAATALAQAPFDLLAILFVALPALVVALDAALIAAPDGVRRLRAAAAVGWWFGFGALFSGLWWVGAAFLVEAETFAWALPFAVTALPAGLALFYALATMLAALAWWPGAPRVLSLAVAIGLAEWLRGHVLTGFPWNGLGTAFAAGDALMQSAALVGAYGLAPLTVAIFAAPAAFLGPAGTRRGAVVLAVVAAAGFGGLALWGHQRLAAAAVGEVPGLALRIVQPAIDQSEKWVPENRWMIFDTLLGLTGAPPPPPGVTRLAIWPESSVPFLLERSPLALQSVMAELPPGGWLIAGAGRAGVDRAAPDATPPIYNSVLAIDETGATRAFYDKVKLVPFGEFLPFQDTLGRLGIVPVAYLPGGFAAGTSRASMALGGAVPPFVPLVCYEAIFPGQVLGEGARPAWILNVTNDAWFGDTPGPYQHFRQARLRAVEEGLPLVRAANTGISAVVDPYGRVVSSLPLGTRGVLEAGLPVAVAPPLYARTGDWPFLLASAVVAAALASRRLRKL
ncbi:apolipoprotein N-acyltransferase [Pseudoxanthobacter sp. M-2]|uniref:apolipoprotein N-acyltransferase n=1 Tax=Pseudoxanthobacter sp. M-2 TaxID=3078754 RepID=UPI0038FC469B